MIADKELIDFIIENRAPFFYSFRTVLDSDDYFSKPESYDNDPSRFNNTVYHNTLVDGLRLHFRYVTLFINGRL